MKTQWVKEENGSTVKATKFQASDEFLSNKLEYLYFENRDNIPILRSAECFDPNDSTNFNRNIFEYRSKFGLSYFRSQHQNIDWTYILEDGNLVDFKDTINKEYITYSTNTGHIRHRTFYRNGDRWYLCYENNKIYKVQRNDMTNCTKTFIYSRNGNCTQVRMTNPLSKTHMATWDNVNNIFRVIGLVSNEIVCESPVLNRSPEEAEMFRFAVGLDDSLKIHTGILYISPEDNDLLL